MQSRIVRRVIAIRYRPGVVGHSDGSRDAIAGFAGPFDGSAAFMIVLLRQHPLANMTEDTAFMVATGGLGRHFDATAVCLGGVLAGDAHLARIHGAGETQDEACQRDNTEHRIPPVFEPRLTNLGP